MSANLGARDGHLGWCVALHKEFRLDIRLVLLPSFDILYILLLGSHSNRFKIVKAIFGFIVPVWKRTSSSHKLCL